MEVERLLSDFSEIELKHNIHLTLIQDTINKVIIKAGKNLMDLIKTDVNDNCLVIENNNRCNFIRSYDKPVEVHLYFKNISGIIYRGWGNITSEDTIKSDLLNINFWDGAGKMDIAIDTKESHLNIHTGPGDLTVRGLSVLNYLFYAGTGYVHSENLITHTTYITNTGLNDCFIHATDVMECKIFNSGNIYYQGNPPFISSTLTDSGTLIKME